MEKVHYSNNENSKTFLRSPISPLPLVHGYPSIASIPTTPLRFIRSYLDASEYLFLCICVSTRARISLCVCMCICASSFPAYDISKRWKPQNHFNGVYLTYC